VILFATATVVLLLLMQNIQKRKAEATQTVFQIARLDETTIDAVEWGKNFPKQYDGYIRTTDIERTKYGGSEDFQHLDADPLLRTIFNGYAFALDYREERGHAYMFFDQLKTDRVKKKAQPGACLQCHASNLVAYRTKGLEKDAPGKLTDPLTSPEGHEQLMKGWEEVCHMPFAEASQLVHSSITCLDCHDPASMQLRVTRPGFMNGIAALARSDDPVPHLPSIGRWRKGDRKRDYDPNAEASRQEMRSMACGQCHVEYYFKPDSKLVTYPWANGLKMDQIEKYYDDLKFSDWKHADSGAAVLKAQHPEFETWSQGVHARSGVSCADCHMPYKREGAIKVSDHHVRSPMLNIARACQTCHHYEESEIRSRVEAIQDRTKALLGRAESATGDLIMALKSARAMNLGDDQLGAAMALQRKAQWRTDFVNAENSMGFHAPQETARILGEAIDYARQGQLEVARLAPPGPISPPAGTSPATPKPPAAQPAAPQPKPDQAPPK
jgi:nitrite reductase (cytochrome c-552)